MKGCALIAVGVDLPAVESGALFRIGEQLEGPADLFEAFLGLLVAGARIRVQALGELSVGAPNLVGRGRGDALDGARQAVENGLRRAAQPVVELAPDHEVHGVEVVAVGARHLVHGHDAGVAQAQGGGALLLEAAQGVAGGVGEAQDLERDAPLQLLVEGGEDDAGRPGIVLGAELADLPVEAVLCPLELDEDDLNRALAEMELPELEAEAEQGTERLKELFVSQDAESESDVVVEVNADIHGESERWRERRLRRRLVRLRGGTPRMSLHDDIDDLCAACLDRRETISVEAALDRLKATTIELERGTKTITEFVLANEAYYDAAIQAVSAARERDRNLVTLASLTGVLMEAELAEPVR